MIKKALLVIVPDRISDIVRKGEYTPRYYNPGDLFDEVHILMTNNDQPDPALLQKTVGHAKLYLHNLPVPSFVRTLGRQPFLLKNWVRSGIRLAEQVQPVVIRTHGNWYNGYLAAQIKKNLGVPLVVSLHTHPDESRQILPWKSDWKSRLISEFMLQHEKETLKAADWVLPVYESISEYAQRRGAKRVEVCYNVLNPKYLQKKESYKLHTPPRIISVGRQIKGKKPDNLIRAVARLEAELILVGDGPYHEYLQSVAQACGISDRVTFHRAIPNDQLCKMLPEFDVFAVHVEYWGIAKAVLEPLLTGLPVIHNRRLGEPVSELQGDWVMLVENTPEAYYQTLQDLLTDHAAREKLGRRAYAHAQERYGPEKSEARYVEIYQQAMNQA